jgi:3-oxoacyl-[acyl-carrier protein] reductase
MIGKLQDKAAIVTGAGSGFGLAIAEKFVEEGCKVILTDITAGNAPKFVDGSSGNATFLKADVSSRED